ncbi:hypothetical protein [Rhodobacter sp. SY28-1]|uniref:hypothetical protein n=1 Tax=Rhodobacter sp. SY28-1 TaxID=2562317 RepID=UPI0010C137EE|nr:hypothetical protein [Rhodobacter sp. SY28-1]
MTDNAMKGPKQATPVTMTMDHDTFFLWLYEIQGRPGGAGEPLPPNMSWERDTDLTSPYFLVTCYMDTEEGIVIAQHNEDAKSVKVTMRYPAPGPNLIRTVRLMLGEGVEAPDDLMGEAA